MSRLRCWSREAVPERRRSEGRRGQPAATPFVVCMLRGDPSVGFSPSDWGFDSGWQPFVT
jgi:hypothetical protein